ncbi:MAG: hypothetical protein AB1515_06700 [Nitrospirota bacterium]
MRIIISLFAFALLLSAGVPVWAATVTGDLTKIDESGSFYIVKDDSGKEHKLSFDATTEKTGDIKEGVRVTVNEDKGHAKSIQAMGGEESPSSLPPPAPSMP